MGGCAVAGVEERTYSLGYARLRLKGVFEDLNLEESLLSSWQPGKTVQRYGRHWQITKILSDSSPLYFGKIGFVSQRDRLRSPFFDDQTNDFAERDIPAGVVVPFMIDISTANVVYQLRPPAVREATFTGALSALLTSDSPYAWEAGSVLEEISFENWNRDVERVTKFDIRLEKPNPHYFDADIAELLVESLEAEYVRLAAAAPPGEALNTDSQIFQQAMDHVLRDYGKASVNGVDKQGAETVWTRLKGSVGSRVFKRRIQEVGPPEAPPAVLERALASTPTPSSIHLDHVGDFTD